MPDYKAPLRDMKFVLHDLLQIEQHYATLQGHEEVTGDTIDAILEEGAKLAENVLAPLNRSGDEEGCHWKDGVVTTPKGFKEAYQNYCDNGWMSMSVDAEYGGQGVPSSLVIAFNELITSSNMSFGMYPGLSRAAIQAILEHGTKEQKQAYLPKMTQGTWSGTMCLTEPHCGTDLGILRTKAEPNADGTYSISGTKIFISAGEHDLTENIIHMVLARLPDAPAGTKGISLFIVPKFMVNADGSVGARNKVMCGSIEHKMGIKASATCVINFDGATGFLIGPANKGLNCMFTMMNIARIGTGLQGLAIGEASFQGALKYAKERLQMRALSGTKYPDKPADPIIVHPDVRRMLLTQKAFTEAGRVLTYFAAKHGDFTLYSKDEEQKKEAEDLLGFLTPICKAFLTDTGFESANLGVQVYGGHGYIREWGMEQLVRDARIAQLYEGTNGIQALDLLGRKILLTQGATMKRFTKIVHKFCEANQDNAALKEFVEPLVRLNKEWVELATKIGMSAMQNPEEVGAASVDFLQYSGYVCFAFFWAWMAQVAQQKLAAGTTEQAFYKTKIDTARFYFQRLLPRTRGLAESMVSGVANLMAVDQENFAF